MSQTPPSGQDPYGQGGSPDPYGQQPSAGPGGGQPPRKGFFGALFDLSFEHFVTPMLVKAVYVLAIVGLVLVWVVFLLTSFSQSPELGVAVLVLGPLGVLLYLCLIRMTLEFYLAVTRMSQEVHQRLR